MCLILIQRLALLKSYSWRAVKLKMSSGKVLYNCVIPVPRQLRGESQTFTCTACTARMSTGLSRPDDAEEPVPVLASRGCDEKRQLTVGQSSSKANGPSFNLQNISTADSAR